MCHFDSKQYLKSILGGMTITEYNALSIGVAWQGYAKKFFNAFEVHRIGEHAK